jgi:hypothetical protein
MCFEQGKASSGVKGEAGLTIEIPENSSSLFAYFPVK